MYINCGKTKVYIYLLKGFFKEFLKYVYKSRVGNFQLVENEIEGS